MHFRSYLRVPGSAIVILAATLNAVPSIPAIGLVLVLSVDWFIGMARALGNLIGNCVATVVVAAWEGDLARDRPSAFSRAMYWSTLPRADHQSTITLTVWGIAHQA